MNLLKFIPIKLTLLLVLGILIGHTFSLGIQIAIVLTLFFLLILGVVFLKQKSQDSPYFGIFAGLATICLGILIVALAHPMNVKNHYTHHNISEFGNWKLKIREVLKPTSFSERYIAEVKGYNSSRSSGKILLFYPNDSIGRKLHVDDEVMVFTIGSEIKPALNPHQFDYKNYLEKKGISHQLKLAQNNHIILKSATTTIHGLAASFRNKIKSKLKLANFGENQLGIIQALFLGKRDDISETTYTEYKDAGAIHILAVSGLHIGILLLFIEFLLRPLEMLPRGKTVKLVLIVFFLWGFAFLAGLSPSVVRAVTMFSFVAYALYLNRPSNTYNILALSMFFILLIYNPMLLYDAGFQMSYAAVFAIVWIYPLLQKFWYPKNWFVKNVWQLLSVSIAAQIGVLPISLYYFHQFPGLFFISNLLIVPFLGLILGLGIVVIALILLNIAPDSLIEIFNALIGYMNSVISWVAQQESFIFKNIPFDAIQLILGYCLIIALIWSLTKVSYKRMIVLLVCIIGIQSWSLLKQYTTNQKDIFIVGHKTKSSILVHQKGNQLNLFSSDSISGNNILTNYQIAERIENTNHQIIQNAYQFNNQNLIVLDSTAVYPIGKRATDYILLTQSPKINLERLIDSLQPKILIADGSNYHSYVKRWQKTCANKKLPFHFTGDKGAFELNLE